MINFNFNTRTGSGCREEERVRGGGRSTRRKFWEKIFLCHFPFDSRHSAAYRTHFRL